MKDAPEKNTFYMKSLYQDYRNSLKSIIDKQ